MELYKMLVYAWIFVIFQCNFIEILGDKMGLLIVYGVMSYQWMVKNKKKIAIKQLRIKFNNREIFSQLRKQKKD